MFGLRGKLRDWRGSFHDDLPGELDDPVVRRSAERYVDWIDHGILRRIWHNEHQIAPGVWRSNHPDDARLERLAARGIRTILSLRGGQRLVPHRLEAAKCRELGLRLFTVPLASRAAPERAALLQLLDVFDEIGRPFLMHCKSGADRTSLASAIFLLEHEGASLAEARRQMSLRYLHLRQTRTGVLDRVLDFYEIRLAAGQTGFRDWVRHEYDADSVSESFFGSRGAA